jgi:preprotein translocase subunit SecF
MTSGTMVIALVALTLFGGPALFSFSSGMLFGVFIGTFSSIYVSSIILIYINPRSNKETSNEKTAK